MKKPLHVLALFAVASATSDAAVIFSENFGSTTTNPTATAFSVQQAWDYSDSTGTTVNTNESRLFNPAGVGSQENTHGWISSLTTGNTFQQIQSNNTFSALPALNVGESYVITLTWYAASQTSTTANDVNAYVNFTSTGNSFTFVNGSNGTPVSANFSPQTLNDSNGAADTIGMTFLAEGGSGGYDAGRTFTASFTTTDALNGDAFSLALGRTTNVAASAFVMYDNVSIDVAVVPEPGTALLGGLGVLALLRRRRI